MLGKLLGLIKMGMRSPKPLVTGVGRRIGRFAGDKSVRNVPQTVLGPKLTNVNRSKVITPKHSSRTGRDPNLPFNLDPTTKAALKNNPTYKLRYGHKVYPAGAPKSPGSGGYKGTSGSRPNYNTPGSFQMGNPVRWLGGTLLEGAVIGGGWTAADYFLNRDAEANRLARSGYNLDGTWGRGPLQKLGALIGKENSRFSDENLLAKREKYLRNSLRYKLENAGIENPDYKALAQMEPEELNAFIESEIATETRKTNIKEQMDMAKFNAALVNVGDQMAYDAQQRRDEFDHDQKIQLINSELELAKKDQQNSLAQQIIALMALMKQ